MQKEKNKGFSESGMCYLTEKICLLRRSSTSGSPHNMSRFKRLALIREKYRLQYYFAVSFSNRTHQDHPRHEHRIVRCSIPTIPAAIRLSSLKLLLQRIIFCWFFINQSPPLFFFTAVLPPFQIPLQQKRTKVRKGINLIIIPHISTCKLYPVAYVLILLPSDQRPQ